MPNTLTLKRTEALPEIIEPLLLWYQSQARSLPWREHPSPYRVWISEIMLQQTRVEAVKPYFERFTAALPDIRSLAECPEEKLLKLWEGLGYYSRARNLQKAAIILQDKYQVRLPADFDQLLTLPGIGRYTAGAVASIAYAQKAAAVDGNVLRVITRLIACSEDILKERTKRAVEAALLAVMPAGKAAGLFNQALMELGATVCLPKNSAHCPACPLKRLCLAFAEDCIAAYPCKAARKARRIETYTILRLEKDTCLALRQRPAKGLLASLWEFPNLPGHLTKKAVIETLFQAGFDTITIQKLPPAVHIFSHVEWHMYGWQVHVRETLRVAETSPVAPSDTVCLTGLSWHTPAEIAATYSIPAAFHYFFQ